MPDRPRGTVAFLFTDVEASTRLWQAHRDAMPAAYARHDAILRDAVAEHAGVVYKVIGDAYQAAFPTAPAALAAAFTAQQRLQREDWSAPGLPEPLRVRMALHAGDVEPDPDGDYRSPVLNRLGRLLGVGHGGQVLLSQAVTQLARDRLPEGAGLLDLGEHRLKDLLEPECISQLLQPDLVTAFPPLSTLDRRPHNLPLQPTPMVGREEEVAEVVGLLRRSDVRLVTLTGSGGTGKTRLSLQAAAEVVEEFPDGVWFVPLATITDPVLVPSALADALGLHEEGGRSHLQAVHDHLRGRSCLLLLDNLEQVLTAAPVINDLLTASPESKILTTSRAPLRLRAEREFFVPPLRLPKRKPPPTANQLNQYAAVRLFIERAQAVRRDFAVDATNAPAIAEICHRLDGLPLAIELAAARVKMLPPQAMLSRLEQRLPVLTGGARDLPLRQQTLRAAIAWSYNLLDPDEQRLYRRLSVFAGGWTLEAAEAVAGSVASGELDLDVFDGLSRLVDHSLLRQEEGPGGEPRFAMLETIREFGLDLLTAAGEADEARERHAGWFLELAEATDPVLTEASLTAETIDRLEAEQDNFRAALAWAEHRRNAEVLLRLAAALSGWWLTQGRLNEAAEWLSRAIDGNGGASPKVLARALYADGSIAMLQGDYRRSGQRAQAALTLSRELGETARVAEALQQLAGVADVTGDPDLAERYFDEALTAARCSGDRRVLSMALNNIGFTASQHGDLPRARLLLEEAHLLARELGNVAGTAATLHSLGEVTRLEGNDLSAAVLYRESLSTAAPSRDRSLIAEALWGLAAVHAATDRPGQAVRLAAAEEAIRETAGIALEPLVQAEQERLLADLRSTLGDAAFDAAWVAGQALSLDEAITEGLRDPGEG